MPIKMHILEIFTKRFVVIGCTRLNLILVCVFAELGEVQLLASRKSRWQLYFLFVPHMEQHCPADPSKTKYLKIIGPKTSN